MSSFWAFFLIDAIPIIFVIASCPLKGLSRLLAPDTLVVIVLFSVFAVRPLFLNRLFYGLMPTHDGEIVASVVGTLLLWSIAIGVYLSSHRYVNARASESYTTASKVEPANHDSYPSAVRAVLITIVALVFYFGAQVAFFGLSAVTGMAAGRTATAVGVPEVIVSIPLAGSIASAALILSRMSRNIFLSEWLAIGFCSSASLIATSLGGDRRYMIPAILIVVIALLMRRPLRIRLWHLPMGLLALSFLAALPNIRSAGARKGGEGLVGAFIRSFSESGGLRGLGQAFFVSYDTEMYDFTALLAEELDAGRLQLGLGSGTIIEFISHPFPKNITPFVERTLVLKEALFNYGCIGGSCKTPFPVLSAGGTLFLDGWYLGVVIGGVALGFGSRRLSQRWARAAKLSIPQNLVTAICSSYALIAARTDTIYAIWWCIYALIIAAVIVVVLGVNRPLSPRIASEQLKLRELHSAG